MKVKICGLRELGDAEYALECGADYLGFVFEPTSPRYVGSPLWAPDWLHVLNADKVAVFGRASTSPDAAFGILQAHTWEIDDPRRRFHVLRVHAEGREGDSDLYIEPDDTLLLDRFHPQSHGGTGEQIDWEATAVIREKVSCRLFLAGGLTPENVATAIQIVRPDGVDVSSGVECSPGVKDRHKIRDFIQAAREALQ